MRERLNVAHVEDDWVRRYESIREALTPTLPLAADHVVPDRRKFMGFSDDPFGPSLGGLVFGIGRLTFLDTVEGLRSYVESALQRELTSNARTKERDPMANSRDILRRLEAARSQLREWKGFHGLDFPKEWIGEIGGALEALNANTARRFYELIRGARSGDVGSGDLEDFFAEEVGRLRSKIELGDSSPPHYPRSPSGNKVFLVHGHQEDFAQTIARFVEKKLGLEIVILHEQPNKGKTLIEKFLGHAERVDFAIALWTADDEGRARTEEHLKYRARQNVVFETGFFIGGLGRERVYVIYEPGVELPSDYSGVVYIPMSEWQTLLPRELRAAGLPVASD